jgi:hypothetical protein
MLPGDEESKGLCLSTFVTVWKCNLGPVRRFPVTSPDRDHSQRFAPRRNLKHLSLLTCDHIGSIYTKSTPSAPQPSDGLQEAEFSRLF